MKSAILISLVTFIVAACRLHAGLTPIGGHVDVRFRWTNAGAWTCQAVIDGGVALDPAGVSFQLSDKPYVAGNPAISGARFTQPASSSFAFTGAPPGKPLWIAVQGTPGIGEAWPGLENNQQAGTFGSYIPADMRVSRINPRPWIKISLDGYVPPPGTDADFSLWTTSGGSPVVWMSSHDPAVINDYYFAEGTHNHMNWGFTAPGIHTVRLKASAFAGPGESNPTLVSDAFTLTFAIGPFAQWQAVHFNRAELDDEMISGPAADPDHDGMENLVEFAFGLDPASGSSAPVVPGLGLPSLTLVEEAGVFYEQLEYPRRRAGSQFAPLVYSPVFQAALAAGGWAGEGVTVTAADFPPGLESLNPVWELVKARRPAGTSRPSGGFARVRVSFGE